MHKEVEQDESGSRYVGMQGGVLVSRRAGEEAEVMWLFSSAS